MRLPGNSPALLAALDERQQFSSATLELLDNEGNAVATYSFTNVWISDIEHAGEANSATAKVALRYGSVTLSSEGSQGSFGGE